MALHPRGNVAAIVWSFLALIVIAWPFCLVIFSTIDITMLRQSGKLLSLVQRSQVAATTQLQNQLQGTSTAEPTTSCTFGQQQFRFIGNDKVPEFWGKPSKYTAGTDFLGTPQNHTQMLYKRPLSPDVIEIDNRSAHYKFPAGALSSITNRATGVALSVAFAGASLVALVGDLPGTILHVAATSPLLLVPFKFLVGYTVVFHYLGGVRHIVWDKHSIGKMTDKTSLLEIPVVEKLSKAMFIGSGIAAAILALL